jgi:sec-independent protein translocase protein TatA
MGMGRIGMPEIIIIGLAIILLFGAKKLPEIAAALGKAIREFKKASKEVQDGVKDAVDDKGDEHKA